MIPVYGTININQAKAASTAPETAWGGWHDDTNLISTECCIVTGAQFLHCCVQVGVVEVVDFLPSHIERKVIFPNIILYYYVLSLCIYMYICHIRDFFLYKLSNFMEIWWPQSLVLFPSDVGFQALRQHGRDITWSEWFPPEKTLVNHVGMMWEFSTIGNIWGFGGDTEEKTIFILI